MRQPRHRHHGFTLIELSIVLVIIGLIVGGVLVGQDLIKAAAVRAQISQIEKYNTAVNTFKVKYGYIPGDIPDPYASQFGFAARGQYAGEGDGNGVIEGVSADAPASNNGYNDAAGETAMFWVDLSAASFLDGSFNTASTHLIVALGVSGTALNNWLPTAKIGNGNYVYIWSRNNINYYGLSIVAGIANNGPIYANSGAGPGLSVAQAYNIDRKIDDGLPGTGNVTAEFATGGLASWPPSMPSIDTGTGSEVGSGSQALVASSSTCFDNGNVHHVAVQFSMTQNNGSGLNCALSFKMQGAAR